MDRGLRLVYWNANGVGRQVQQLRIFAEDNKADIILLCETHLTPSASLTVPNYCVYRNDRGDGRRGGGTAVLIRNSMPHYPVDCPTLNTIEATTVIVRMGNDETLVAAVYNSPSLHLDTGDLDRLRAIRTPCILAGDLNAKHQSWNSRVPNDRGRVLYRYAETADVSVIAPTEPTFYRNDQVFDVLDVAVLDGIAGQYGVWSLSALDSDHNPVLLELSDVPLVPSGNATITRRKVDWVTYSDKLNALVDPDSVSRNVEELEKRLTEFTSDVQRCLAEATTMREVRLDSRTELPREIRNLIREKNRTRKVWQKYRRPEHRQRLTALTDEVRTRLQDFRDQKWHDAVVDLSPRDNSIWKFSKRLTKKRTHVPALVDETGRMVADPKDKTELVADALREQFQTVPPVLPFHGYVEDFVDGYLKTQHPDNEPIRVEVDEVKSITKRLNARKAPGDDEITNSAIKKLPERALRALTNIINDAYRFRYFPTTWKLARVITIPKPGKPPMLVRNHRPISLLSGLSKVFERTLLERINDFCFDRNLIVDEQFGFRSGHSTVQQLLRLTEKITKGFNEKRHTAVVFLDMEKAFDKVWHDGLVYKLIYMGMPFGLVRIIASYLKERSFYVASDGEKSTARNVGAGVPQGSVLGPTLFTLYVNDVPRDEMTALYADDTAIVSQSWSEAVAIRRSQEHLRRLEDFYTTWRLSVNVQKSEAVLFTKKPVRPSSDLSMFGLAIPWKSEAKYLGVTLDRRLTYARHASVVVGKAYGQLSRLYPLLNRNSKLSLDVKRLLYVVCIRPILTYASPAWAYQPAALRRLQVCQNKCMRVITGAHFFVRNQQLHADLKLPTIKELVSDQALKLYGRAESSENSLIRGLGCYDADNPWHRFATPKTLLS